VYGDGVVDAEGAVVVGNSLVKSPLSVFVLIDDEKLEIVPLPYVGGPEDELPDPVSVLWESEVRVPIALSVLNDDVEIWIIIVVFKLLELVPEEREEVEGVGVMLKLVCVFD